MGGCGLVQWAVRSPGLPALSLLALQMHSLPLSAILCLRLCLGDLLPCPPVKIQSSPVHGSLFLPRRSSRAPLQSFSPGPFTTSALTVHVCPSVLLCQLHEVKSLSESSLCPRYLAQFLVATPSMLSGCVWGPSRRHTQVTAEEVALPLPPSWLDRPPSNPPPREGRLNAFLGLIGTTAVKERKMKTDHRVKCE